MAERDDTRSERDGEETPRRGPLSVLNQSWDREAGRKWGEEFLAREAKRAQSLRLSPKKLRWELLQALRREINAVAYCVYCGKERLHTNETDKRWVERDDCAECYAKGVRPRDLLEKHCRYCGTRYTRAEALAGGKHHHAWNNGNKCTNCVDALKKIEDSVKRMLRERLRDAAQNPANK